MLTTLTLQAPSVVCTYTSKSVRDVDISLGKELSSQIHIRS